MGWRRPGLAVIGGSSATAALAAAAGISLLVIAVAAIPDIGRAILIGMGLLADDFTADDLRRAIPRMRDALQGKGFNAAQAATIILDGVRSGAWRILVGKEAEMLDEQVRANPEAPFHYENYAQMYGPLIAQAEAEAAGTPEP